MHAILGLLLAMVAAVAAFSNRVRQYEWTNRKWVWSTIDSSNYTNGDFFIRSAKWIPSGGAGLVSGRGNFRPGFTGRDWRSAMAEPNFNKRSAQPWFSEDY
ncbi:hypothetical protein RB195_000371 [Necator americanus]|uniref:Secreted protein n=1 Tax=Necator americanus TaxID=51031 RepID=A0ABR1D9C2_NECAM